MAERLPRLLAALAIAAGLALVGVGLSVFFQAWQTSRAWAGSAEALHADLPGETPLWLDPATDDAASAPPSARSGSSVGDEQQDGRAIPSPVADQDGGRVNSRTGPTATALPGMPFAAFGESATVSPSGSAAAEPTPPVLAAPGEVGIEESDFRFLDPPEPGAHARLAVTIRNRADRPTGPVTIVVAAHWLQSFQVLGTIPPVLDDRPGGDGERQFVFGGLAPGERQTLELHVLSAADEVDAPDVRVLLAGDISIGEAHPRTVAPRPRPGPARAITIPRLGVRAAVVPVAWEPPPYIVGQLQGTAAVSEGNTVLVGHLRGAAGDVFARLDQLRPGDEVVAESRGQEYTFVVSETAVRPYDDIQETLPTGSPRLTMMTCTGVWNIARQDYSHRLWVIAEPPELAAQTIKTNAERAAQTAREAEAAAAERAAHEAEAQRTPVPASDIGTPVEAATPPPTTPDPPAVSLTPGPPAVLAEVDSAATAPAPATQPPAALASPGPDDEIAAPGIRIEAPADGAAVPSHLVVRGRRMADAAPELPLWLVVKADVVGSRWYALDRPLDVRADGTWDATIELGGAAGVHHVIRVGAVDAATDGSLRRHAAEHPGQPLEDLPAGFRNGASVTVERR